MNYDAQFVVGIDPATTTGLVVIELATGDIALAVDIKGHGKGIRRAQAISGLIVQSLTKCNRYGKTIACIEGYAYGNQHTLATLVEIGTTIRLDVMGLGVEYVDVAPSRLKKYACGKGNVKKDEVRLSVFKKWGFEHPSNNVVDAFVLARIGADWMTRTVVSKVQGKILKELFDGSTGTTEENQKESSL